MNFNTLTQASRTAQGKLPFLDGIRGFAALWVLASHCLILCGWSLPLVSRGDVAVDVFMIMSGFLMTYHYYGRQGTEPWESPRTWFIFYIRRFFRIAPLYYVLMFIALIIGGYLGSARQEIAAVFTNSATSMNRYQDTSILNIFMHLTFLFGLFPKYAFATPLPDWSIGLEMQFYACYPFLMLAFKRLSFFGMTLLLCTIPSLANNFFVPRLIGNFPMPSFLPLKINFFVIGILLATAKFYQIKSPNIQRKLLGLVTITTILSGINSLEKSLIILCIFTLISLILFYNRKQDILKINYLIQFFESLLSSKLATFMADASYSVYLFHLLLLIPLAAMFVNFNFYVLMPGLLRFVLLFMAVAIPTYSIAPIIYKYIELPGINFSKNLVKNYL